MHPVTKKEIIEYYASSQWLYRTLWSPHAQGMHVGFWDEGVHSVDEAVENENRVIMDVSHITDQSLILDAGCGMGSTAVYIGTHTKARVIGVSLVQKQIDTAIRYAKRVGIYPRVTFVREDYTQLSFPDTYFDAVIGIESICHAYPKEAFLKEAWRVLKPKGRLTIADAYMTRSPKNFNEQTLYTDFCSGFALSELIEVGKMEEQLRKSNFSQSRWTDTTKRIVNGAEYLYAKSNVLQLVVPFASLFPFSWARALVRNAKAARASMGLLKSGAGCYGIFTAVK